MGEIPMIAEVVAEVVELPDIDLTKDGDVAMPSPANPLPFPIGATSIEVKSGVAYIWHVFGTPLAPNQIGEVTFTNIPGQLPVAGCFGEWAPTSNTPHIGSANYILWGVQRGNGSARVRGQNTFNANLVSAAGLIVIG